MQQVKVVIRFLDGGMVKGFTNDFSPNKPIFHVGSGPSERGDRVEIRKLKAIFFVKDFDGNPDYDESKAFTEGQKVQGKKVELKFKDGEVQVGTVLGYDPQRQGFFLVPTDPGSNNIRVFVVSAAVEEFRYVE